VHAWILIFEKYNERQRSYDSRGIQSLSVLSAADSLIYERQKQTKKLSPEPDACERHQTHQLQRESGNQEHLCVHPFHNNMD
jgi:hypothetical protein